MWNDQQRYIRDLAKRVRTLAHSEGKREVVARYRRINGLVPLRPPIIVHPPAQAIHDIFELGDLKTTDPQLRSLEQGLKMKLLRDDRIGDDMPLTDRLYSGFSYRVSDWMEGYSPVRLGDNLESSHFEPCILQPEDFRRLQRPRLHYDRQATQEGYGRMEDLLGDILTVVKGVPFSSVCGWGESMIDQLVEMRGLSQLYYDMVDRPMSIHGAMEFMTRGHLDLLDQFQAEGLLVANNGENVLGSSSPGFCDELGEMEGASLSEARLWGFAQAQEFSEVSPAMLEEFVLPYQARILNRFGLSLYGCCEAIEHKIDVVAGHIHNLRMVSISPFTDPEIAGAKCRGRFVYAWKPQPSHMIDFDRAAIQEDFRRTLRHVKGCCVTINLMDVFNYGNRPERFPAWVQLARRMVSDHYTT